MYGAPCHAFPAFDASETYDASPPCHKARASCDAPAPYDAAVYPPLTSSVAADDASQSAPTAFAEAQSDQASRYAESVSVWFALAPAPSEARHTDAQTSIQVTSPGAIVRQAAQVGRG